VLKQLHSFLGFRNYYKDFIADYSKLARPLHELTKKSVKYFWGTLQQQAFKTLKHKLHHILYLETQITINISY
jgi:hypothetical protein